MSRPNCRNLLIDAAEAVVREDGGARLTLDAVADKAGVSKGGLLYHFPTKEALVEGMIARLLQRAIERQARAEASLPDDKARSLKAEVLGLLVGHAEDDRVASALLAAVANEPRLMTSILDFHRERFNNHAPGTPGFERRALTLLAADGLFFLELLQVSPFTDEQRKALIEEMLHLAEEAVQQSPDADAHTP